MIAKYVSGQSKKGQEPYLSDLGTKNFKRKQNKSMASLTQKGFKNFDYALAIQTHVISDFQKLPNLNEDQNDGTDSAQMVSPINQAVSFQDSDKLNLDLEIDLSQTHREYPGDIAEQKGQTLAKAFVVNRRPSLPKNHRKTKSSLPNIKAIHF